ncbi:hypothetical protein KBT16_03360 [Nostoc sp. CCCryo 231-06]|nr:hypothetical protein [Nostoc sp. CCCryo 231-06]
MDTNTKKVLSILPPLEQAPTPTAPIQRPVDDHATPHTLPPKQQQQVETAQPYRPHQTYDGLPTGGSIGSGNALKAAALTRGQQNAQDEALAALAYSAGYAITGAIDAITGQYSDNSKLLFPRDGVEDASYEFGHKITELTKDSIDKAKDAIRDLRDNPPHFDIPQPKIPKIEFPEIPEFKFPELPELDIPGFRLPEPQDKDRPNPNPKIDKPKPIPKKLTRQLRELELSSCGSISFGYARAAKVLGFRDAFTKDGSYYQERIQVPASIQEVYDTWIKYNLEEGEPPTIENFLSSSGGTGGGGSVEVSQFTYYDISLGLGGAFNADRPTGSYPFNDLYMPYYSFGTANISIQGVNNNLAVNAVLNKLDEGANIPGEVYKINVSMLNAKDCPLGKPPPPLVDPPPPPEQEMCCPDIDYRKIKAMIDDAISKLDLVAAIPMSWQIRNEGGKPQLIIQCAEENGVDKEGNKKYKSAMYPISVPHWDGAPGQKISLPSYIKGNYEGIYTLNDNSKVTINAKNETECKKILNAIKPYVPKQYTKDAYFKGGVIVRDKPIKESRVKPRYGRYFKDGQKNNKPNWRVDFT